MQITLTILGEPTAQKRHRHTSRGKFTRTYDPSASDKADFLSIVQNKAPQTPIDGPVKIEIFAYFSRPKSHFRTGKNSHILKDDAPKWHTARPDCDNLAKFIFDALNKVYWRDDSCICDQKVIKRYSDKPRTEIFIWKI